MKRDKSEVRIYIRAPFYLKGRLIKNARKGKVSVAELVRKILLDSLE